MLELEIARLDKMPRIIIQFTDCSLWTRCLNGIICSIPCHNLADIETHRNTPEACPITKYFFSNWSEYMERNRVWQYSVRNKSTIRHIYKYSVCLCVSVLNTQLLPFYGWEKTVNGRFWDYIKQLTVSAWQLNIICITLEAWDGCY